MAGNLADIITCAKFQDEIFRGYDFTGGQISHFLIDFCMGLTTVQRDCAASDKTFNVLYIYVCLFLRKHSIGHAFFLQFVFFSFIVQVALKSTLCRFFPPRVKSTFSKSSP